MKARAGLGRAAPAPLLLLCLLPVHARAANSDRAGTAAAAQAGTLVVHARPVARTFRAYAEVQPVAVTPMRAVEPGVVRRLVLPGERVKAGQVLAVLGGPQAQSLLAQRRGALRAASIQLAADRRKLAAQLVTRQTLAADEAAYAAARGKLQVAVQTLTLRAPASGQVLAVHAADGEEVAAGESILTLQTSRPWLTAAFYGAQALEITPGMRGRFQPLSGPAIPVRVKTVSQTLDPGGGEQVGMLPASVARHDAPAAAWRSGEWGTVRLTGAARPLIAIPTRALILDRARWWVLVRTLHGDRPRQVVPGPTRGWMTYIAEGLKPGQRIVIENAFLEFHRGIAQRYTPPN